MDKENLLSDNWDSGNDTEIKHSLDSGSEIPPPYPGSTAYQTPAVITEPESYPATTSTLMSELPPGNSDAISQPKKTKQRATVASVTTQPLRQTRSSTRIREPYDSALAENMLGFSVCCCIICCLCGSPLTLFCFVPAIMLLSKVK